MRDRSEVLFLILKYLDAPTSIDSFEDRKAIQKAVYLAQLTGVDLGYRFSWYLSGPYSSGLTRDYYGAAAGIADDQSLNDVTLTSAAQAALSRLAPVMKVPESLPMPQHAWLELLASVDYLRRRQGLSDQEADAILEQQKPSIAPYARYARKALAPLE